MTNDNFKWLTYDIDSSLVLKVIYKNKNMIEENAMYNIVDVLDAVGDSLDIVTANIDDLTKLLTIGIVRFVNMADLSDVIDIPFRNLYKLYENGNVLGETSNKFLSFNDVDAFSIIDGNMRNNGVIHSTIINNVSNDLSCLMKIASDFGNYGVHKQFEALTKITMLNHRRIVSDKINRLSQCSFDKYGDILFDFGN